MEPFYLLLSLCLQPFAARSNVTTATKPPEPRTGPQISTCAPPRVSASSHHPDMGAHHDHALNEGCRIGSVDPQFSRSANMVLLYLWPQPQTYNQAASTHGVYLGRLCSLRAYQVQTWRFNISRSHEKVYHNNQRADNPNKYLHCVNFVTGVIWNVLSEPVIN